MNAKRQIPHVMKYLLTSWRALLASLALFGMLGSIDPAMATTVTAVNGLSCAGDRNTANCTAGEFTVGVTITNQPGSPTSCVAGDYVTLIGSVSLTGTNADRYDVGFFTGENGNDPKIAGTGQKCSVVTFPTSPLPWFTSSANACGEYKASGVDNPVINNIKVLCAGDATGHLKVPYTLVYSTDASGTCTGPTDVTNSAPSKCNAGTAVVDTATFVKGSVTVTKKTVPAGDTQSFPFTASGTNPVMSGDDSFNLAHSGSKQVRMGITDANGTLTITETATTDWESTATIACTKPDGSSSAGFVTTNGATRTITATLSNTNPKALCTITNTRAVSATNSTVVANPTSVASNGVSTSTITVTLRDTSVAGNPVAGKTVTLTAGSGSSTITTLTGVTDVNGQATFTVKDTVAESVTYTAHDTTDSINITQTATVTFALASVGSFNAFETGTAASAIAGPIYTKLAGIAFGLDVVAIVSGAQASGFSGNVKVELLANTGTAGSGYGANNCPNASSVMQTIASSAIAGGRSTVNFAAVAGAYRDVRVRISYPTTSPTVTTCSSDSFVIRPQVFTIVSTNATNSATSGIPVIKAGGGSFNLTATAVTGYDGTPSLDATKVIGSSTAGTLSGSFGAASSGSGVAAGNAFTYSEVGNFGLSADAVYDTSFTSIDQGSDCVPSSTSNALSGGKYGCRVGSNAVAQTTGSSGFGRFIPDHFNTTVLLSGSVPIPCPTGLTCPLSYNGFVYAGQPFSVQVTAKNASDVTTVNYNTTTGFSKATTLSAFGVLGTTTAPTGAGTLGVASVAATAFAAGTLTETAEKFTFTTTPTAPTAIYIRASDTEASSLRASNPTTASVEGGVQVVSGRIHIPNVYGSELLPLPMTATVQYYSGTNWVTSTTDSTTAFNSNLSTAGGNLVSAVVSGLGGGVVVSSPGPSAVAAGVRIVTLNAPGVPGSANMSLNAPVYLPSVTGRATFGIYKSRLIYRRENY
ncbi:MAG: Ig-like domain-containing protein [Burkholderiaceae bacterium]|nr:Ig-like domain-containing protein [Burkholderiaceae bacterium]